MTALIFWRYGFDNKRILTRHDVGQLCCGDKQEGKAHGMAWNGSINTTQWPRDFRIVLPQFLPKGVFGARQPHQIHGFKDSVPKIHQSLSPSKSQLLSHACAPLNSLDQEPGDNPTNLARRRALEQAALCSGKRR